VIEARPTRLDPARSTKPFEQIVRHHDQKCCIPRIFDYCARSLPSRLEATGTQRGNAQDEPSCFQLDRAELAGDSGLSRNNTNLNGRRDDRPNAHKH
jgi:hypothetical protein